MNINIIAKEYKSLTFTDDFIFCKVMESNEDLCRELLELILGKKIRKIQYLTKQKTIDITSDGKGIRLDVYVEDDENSVFDIEMQTISGRNLPKRSRYYQGMIDLNLIAKGEDYKELKKSYIIFLCIDSPFKMGLHKYSFENRCNECMELLLGDDSTKIFLTPDGTADDVSKELGAFLDYLAGQGTGSAFAAKLEAAVEKVRNSEEWRLEYMTLFMRDRENFNKGIEQGKLELLQQFIESGKMTMEEAADSIGMTVEEFTAKIQN